MTAHRVVDEHCELGGIGQTTHEELDTHVSGSEFLVLSSSTNVPPVARTLCVGDGLLFDDEGPQGKFCIYVDPAFLPAIYRSHWDTADGVNGSQLVTETLARTITRISTPNGGEGNPFETGGWAGTNQDTHINNPWTLTTPDSVTGFGSSSYFELAVVGADGLTKLQGAKIGPLTGSGVFSSGSFTLTLSGFDIDAGSRFAATASISIDVSTLLSESGRYHVTATHRVDEDSDGSGLYTYIQEDIFYDSNPTTPSIDGSVGLIETSGSVVTKHLSGIEYYTIPSAFTVSVSGINKLNEDTIKTSQNLCLIGTDYGLSTLNHSPFGTGASNFSGWLNDNDNVSASYVNTSWTISNNNYRYIGPTANVSSFPRDPWNQGSTVSSANENILIDTYGVTSNNTFESFDDEARRQTDSYNSGSTSGNWDSTKTLVNGEALVFAGQLMIPSESTYIRGDGSNSANADWTSYLPDASGSNPDYTNVTGSACYYRSWPDTAGSDRASFTVVINGNFVSGSALADLEAEAIRIFIRKIDGIGNTGSLTPYPLSLHGPSYNFGTFDDGVSDGQCRELTSSGNTINGTFGGFAMNDGIYTKIEIINPNTKISSVSWTFI